jgi:hypothetical protein
MMRRVSFYCEGSRYRAAEIVDKGARFGMYIKRCAPLQTFLSHRCSCLPRAST